MLFGTIAGWDWPKSVLITSKIGKFHLLILTWMWLHKPYAVETSQQKQKQMKGDSDMGQERVYLQSHVRYRCYRYLNKWRKLGPKKVSLKFDLDDFNFKVEHTHSCRNHALSPAISRSKTLGSLETLWDEKCHHETCSHVQSVGRSVQMAWKNEMEITTFNTFSIIYWITVNKGNRGQNCEKSSHRRILKSFQSSKIFLNLHLTSRRRGFEVESQCSSMQEYEQIWIYRNK